MRLAAVLTEIAKNEAICTPTAEPDCAHNDTNEQKDDNHLE
jgi:hypothetical protein